MKLTKPLMCLLALSTLFTSCSGDKVHEQEKVSIKDIDWEIKEGIKDGRRYALFTFTNNSEYTIYELELVLTPKSSFKGAKLDEFYSYIETEYNIGSESMDYIKEHGALRIECQHYELFDDPVLPGKSFTTEATYYGLYYVLNMDYYEMFEPDMMTIIYEEENMLYTTYYDYKNNSYSHESEPETID